jgi:hypothetical protein
MQQIKSITQEIKNPHLVVLDLQWRLVCHPTTPYDGGGLPA